VTNPVAAEAIESPSANLTVQITTPSGTTDGSVALPAELFDVQSNIPLMHQVVVAQLAAARQGTHKAKNRGEVSGGGKKPYRQKGTGRARQGSTRAPQFTGGGTVHGPVPHGYSQRTPKKMKQAALRGALSDRARGGNVHVLSSLVEGDTPSTKTAVAAIAQLSTARNLLVVVGREDESGWKSLRNAQNVHLLAADQLNTYDVLLSDEVIFTREALEEYMDFSGASLPAAGEVPAASPVSTVKSVGSTPAGSTPAGSTPAVQAVGEPADQPTAVSTTKVTDVADQPVSTATTADQTEEDAQ
jgi:large subunit ribosomal protein L4